MSQNRILFIALLIGAASIHASSTPAPAVASAAPPLYHGQIIDARTIAQLAPKAPEEIEKETKGWLSEHPEIVDALLGYEPFIPMAGGEITLPDGRKVQTFKPLLDNANAALAKIGLPNQSSSNYVFQHPLEKDWLIKVAGHGNRKFNVSHLVMSLEKGNYDFNRRLSQKDYDFLAKHLPATDFDKIVQTTGELIPITTAPKTYQHISRVASSLLLLDAIARGLKGVVAPEMHLVHIPGRPEEVSDRNYIVIEKKLDGKRVEQLTPADKKALEIAIRATGLFDMIPDNIARAPNGDIVLLDLEQPNNENPLQFFHKNEGKVRSNTNVGLDGLAATEKKLAEIPGATVSK